MRLIIALLIATLAGVASAEQPAIAPDSCPGIYYMLLDEGVPQSVAAKTRNICMEMATQQFKAGTGMMASLMECSSMVKEMYTEDQMDKALELGYEAGFDEARSSFESLMTSIPSSQPDGDHRRYGRVGSVVLEMGMTQTAAVDRLSTTFKLSCLGEETDLADCSSLVVLRDFGTRSEFVANVYFQDQKLAFVMESWSGGFNQQDAAPFVTTLFGLLSDLQREGNALASISAAENHTQAGSSRDIYITYEDGTTVSIGLLSGHRIEGSAQPPAVTLSRQSKSTSFGAGH